MAVNNAINAPLPISPANGGTGVASPTIHGVVIAQGSTNMNTIVLGAGQTLIGTTSGDPSGATLTAGTGITVTSASGTITIAASGAGSFGWTDVTGTSQTMAAFNGYIADNASLVTMTFPTTCAVGAEFIVTTKGAGLWKVAQNAGQSINFGNVTTTVGTGGSLQATALGDSVRFVCITANTTFNVISSMGGAITYV